VFLLKQPVSHSEWPRGLRRGSAAARLLRLWVRIPPGNGWLSVVSIVYCQVEVSATSWSLVQRSYTKCCESLSRNLVNEEALAHWGLSCQKITRRTHDSALANTWQCTGEHMTVHWRTRESALANTWKCIGEHMTVHWRTQDSALTNTRQCTGEHMTVQWRTHDSELANTWKCTGEHMKVQWRTHDSALANTGQYTGEHMTMHGPIHDSERANVDLNKTYDSLALNFSTLCNKTRYNYTQRCNLTTAHASLLIPLHPWSPTPCSKKCWVTAVRLFSI
jgi:hypothetical protein